MRDGIQNAIISNVTLDDADRGFLTAWLHLDYGGSGQGFGGYSLYLPSSFEHSENPGNFAGHFIWRCMEIGGVTDWSRLPGKTVRVRIEDGMAKAIGHIVKEDWFDPEVDFNSMKESFNEAR